MIVSNVFFHLFYFCFSDTLTPQFKTVTLLLSHGAFADLVNENGQKPSALCTNQDILSLLLAAEKEGQGQADSRTAPDPQESVYMSHDRINSKIM